MSAGVLLDTSVLLKLVRPDEELSHLADALVRDTLGAGKTLYIPPLLMIEATNGLLQRVRRGTLSAAEASSAIADLAALPLEQVQPPGIHARAMEFAITHQVKSAYDALYVVTAQHLGVELWTADRRLINALGTRAPWVRWIGDYVASSGGGLNR